MLFSYSPAFAIGYTQDMKKVVIVSLIGLAIIVGGVYLLQRQQSNPFVVEDPQVSPTLGTETLDADNSVVTPTSEAEQFISSSPDAAALRAGGSSYLDSEAVYTFLYPSEYALDTQEEGKYTRISKRGATQRGQTEIYDGVIVAFERVDLQGVSLSDWVDAQIKTATDNGMVEVLEPKKTAALNTYPGFTYELQGLGSSKYIVVQQNPSSTYAVNISFLVADPEQQGYQQEVDAILSTLELKK